MRASIRWLSEILGLDLDAAQVAERLTMTGVEIDAVVRTPVPDPGVVTATIIERAVHPARRDLFIVKVDAGEGPVEVVCGAPNTPAPGARVVLARPGAVVRGRALEVVEIASVRSAGMLCSEAELGVGPDADGIMILAEDHPPGTPLAAAYPLDDSILEFTITPNRPDCLGHVGLAREVAAVLGIGFRPVAYETAAPEISADARDLASVRIDDARGCPRYAAAVVRGVGVAPSPFALRNRLHSLGVRPISNVVDVTNLILLRDNQPLHAFDLRLLPGGVVVVRRASRGETIVTLDGISRALDAEDLVIASRDRAVAIAGVMGGEGTSISDDTTDVLIECAYFDAGSIRRTSSRLRLASESSYRFERGTDPAPLAEIVRSAAAMMVRLGGGAVARGVVDVHPRRIEPARIDLRVARVAGIVGAPFEVEECRLSLLRLGCTVISGDGALSVVAPTHRPDLTREIDLIEEIARLRGYDAIPATRPCVQAGPPRRASYDLVMRAKRALASSGLDEIVTLGFASGARLAALGLADGAVGLANPLSSDRDVMRTSLLPGLVDLLVHHVSRSRRALRVFEVGNVFRKGEGGLVPGVVEAREAAGLVYGPRPAWVGEHRGSSDFHDAWGVLAHAVRDLWCVEARIERMAEAPAWLHPRSACRVVAGGHVVGWVGELNPRISREMDLPRGRDGAATAVGIFAFEITDRPSALPRYRRFSEMPASERDIAMIFPEQVESGSILDVVRKHSGSLLEEACVFDVYRDASLGEGMKSVAFRIVLRAEDRTLTQEEVDGLVDLAVSDLAASLGGRIRG